MQKEFSDIKFQIGEIYPFTVNTIHDDFCELLDQSGFPVYLQHTRGLRLVKGQEIRCRVVANTQKRPKIELVDADSYSADLTKLSPEVVDSIIRPIARGWDTTAFSQLLMMSEVEDRSFENDCREWIHSQEKEKQDLNTISEDCTRFMEESDFFGRCNPDERETYEQRLTLLIELLGYYICADKLLEEGRGREFIDDILQKLEKTGYVYHPQQNFNVMSCLLLNDASLIEGSITRLFNIIRHWPLNIWTREPFRSTLIKVLNLYVEDNIWRVDRQDDNQNLIKSLMQAIAILLLLANSYEKTSPLPNTFWDTHEQRNAILPDERLNLARLCVLSTYHEDYKNGEVLDLGLNYLVGSNYYRPAYTLDDTDGYRVSLMLKAYKPALKPWPVDTTSSFLSGQLRLVISPEGITLHSGEQKERPVLPEDMGLWENLQVWADRHTALKPGSKLDIRVCQKMWEDVERDLFLPKKEDEPHPARHASAPVHNIGDKVTVVVTRTQEYGTTSSIAYCRFEGEQQESAYIQAEDIVSYIHKVYVWMFEDYNGRPLYLDAVITGQDEDGLFRLSMLDSIKDFVCDKYKVGATLLCSIGGARDAGEKKKSVPAVSPDGESISLSGYSSKPLLVGDVVEATVQGRATGTFHLFCSINKTTGLEKIKISQAFHNLMLNYGYSESYENRRPEKPAGKDESETDVADFEHNDRMLDAAYIKELIRLIDRRAFTDADYVRSYTYLAFARVLCRMIGWDTQASYYRGRLQLISLLYDFAVNDHVDPNNLNSLLDTDPDLFRNDTSMSDKFQQLRIVSYLDTQDPESYDELWKYRVQAQATTRKVASLAIAYKMLRSNRMDNQANDVLNRIKDTLNLKGYESNLETYGPGIETRSVEYKTSIVYPPDNNMRPDLQLQLHNILCAVASFLNTDGGTLYIGVNNSGAGVGVETDLEYKDFHGDRDKYQRTVLDQIALHFGNYISTFIHSHWEQGEKSGKWVLVVEVEPCLQGVELDGEWLFRDDNGKRSLTKAEFAKYNERRQARLKEQGSASGSAAAGADATPAAAGASDTDISGTGTETLSSASPQDTASVQTETTGTAATPSASKIHTDENRDNVLVEYAPDYRPFEACLKFTGNGKLCKLSRYDYDETSALTLAVYEEEAQEGNLVLGYADGSVSKVPVRELLQFKDNKEYSLNTESPLLFASIAPDEDALVSLTREDKAKNRVMVRVDTISRIRPARLQDKGQRLYNEGLAREVLAYHIAPQKDLGAVAVLLDRDARTVGKALEAVSQKTRTALAKWGINLADFQ